MTEINQQQEEKIMNQLKFLWNSVFEMNSYFCIIEQYYENGTNFKEEMQISPAFYHYTYNALIVATFSEVTRMYDSNSKSNLMSFLKYCKDNQDLLLKIHKRSGSGWVSDEKLNENLCGFITQIEELSSDLKKLKTQRDKIYSHNDSKKQEDLNKIISNNPLFLDDMKRMIKVATNSLTFVQALLTNINKKPYAKNIGDWKETLLRVKLE